MKTHAEYFHFSEFPSGNQETFERQVRASVEKFPDNAFCRAIEQKKLKIENFHNMLLMIFHQTYVFPSLFALSAASLDNSKGLARQYLIRHAEEEKEHWTWVLNDLISTKYKGPDPRSEFPPYHCQSFIAFTHMMSVRHPIARLGVASVLEGIGAAYGKKFAMEIIRQLNLNSDQVSFFLGHGDTDVGHTKDIFEVLSKTPISANEWAWLTHAAEMAGKYYKEMYEHI